MRFKVADRVDIMEFAGKGRGWRFGDPPARGIVTAVDEHCLDVHRDDGATERDVIEHYRPETTE